MKKTMTFVFMAAIMAMCLNSCVTRINRPGLQVETNDPEVARAAANAATPYTSVDQALADAIRGRSNSGGTILGADVPQTGIIENNSGQDIEVRIIFAKYPNGMPAAQITANTGVRNIVGYEPLTVRVPRHSIVEITLLPGDWDFLVYDLSRRPGHNQVASGYLHVDVVPGKVIQPAANNNTRTNSSRQTTQAVTQTNPYNFKITY